MEHLQEPAATRRRRIVLVSVIPRKLLEVDSEPSAGFHVKPGEHGRGAVDLGTF
jgi:hypothetical protein